MNETVKNPEEKDELYEHFRFEVTAGTEMLRIDKYLFNLIANTSRNKVQQAAKADCILVNGKPVKQNYKVRPGDTISVLMPNPPNDTEILPENIPLNIIYEDPDLLIVNKEAGMVVHPAYGNYTGTLVNALYYYLQDQKLEDGSPMKPLLVHRIDKNTSGLLAVTKNELAQMRLAKTFFDHDLERRYWALVWGDMEGDSGENRVSRTSGRRVRGCRGKSAISLVPDVSSRCTCRDVLRGVRTITRLQHALFHILAPTHRVLRQPDVLRQVRRIRDSDRHEDENLLLHLAATLPTEELRADPRDLAQIRDAVIDVFFRCP